MIGGWSSSAYAQDVKPATARKMMKLVKPVYPALAQKMNLTGKVRLAVVVTPDGTPSRVQALGGSPLLLQCAADALLKSKWQPAPQETRETIEVNFQAGKE